MEDMSKIASERQRSLECTPVRRRSGTGPEGKQQKIVYVCLEVYSTSTKACEGGGKGESVLTNCLVEIAKSE